MEVDAVAHAMQWLASRRDAQITHVTILTDSLNLLQKIRGTFWTRTGHRISALEWAGHSITEVEKLKLKLKTAWAGGRGGSVRLRVCVCVSEHQTQFRVKNIYGFARSKRKVTDTGHRVLRWSEVASGKGHVLKLFGCQRGFMRADFGSEISFTALCLQEPCRRRVIQPTSCSLWRSLAVRSSSTGSSGAWPCSARSTTKQAQHCCLLLHCCVGRWEGGGGVRERERERERENAHMRMQAHM